jgi:hypothetical protein
MAQSFAKRPSLASAGRPVVGVGRGERAGNSASRALIRRRIRNWKRSWALVRTGFVKMDDRGPKFVAPGDWNDIYGASRWNRDASRAGTSVVPGLS